MKEHEYVIVERVIYKVSAPTPGIALTRFLKNPNADRKYFHAVEERTIEGPVPKTGKLDTWDAYGTMADELIQADQDPSPDNPA